MAELYHYCSKKVLKYILAGKRKKKKADRGYGWLKLSDVRNSNDTYELKMFIKQYEGIGAMSKAYTKSDFWELLERELQVIEKSIECFTFCLSKAGNSLELWERYGDRCKGVSIEFSNDLKWNYIESVRERVFSTLQENNAEAGYTNLFLESLHYAEIKKSVPLHELVEEVDQERDKALKRIMLRKHAAFKGEKEERIVWAFDREKRERLEEIFAHAKEGLIYNKEEACWYLRFPLELVKGVCTGPLFDSKVEEIENLIKRNGINNCSVSLSGIPYAEKRNCRRAAAL